MSEKRDNSGVLFKNSRKEKDTHADYEGNCTINGQEFWMNAWLKKDKNGNTFMSFAFKPKKLPAEQTKQPAFEDRKADDFADQIPF